MQVPTVGPSSGGGLPWILRLGCIGGAQASAGVPARGARHDEHLLLLPATKGTGLGGVQSTWRGRTGRPNPGPEPADVLQSHGRPQCRARRAPQRCPPICRASPRPTRRGGAAGMSEWSTQTIGVVVSWMCYNPQDTRTDTRVWMRRLGRRGREYAGMRNSSRVYFSVGSRACRTPTGALCHSRRSPSACWEAAHAGQDG